MNEFTLSMLNILGHTGTLPCAVSISDFNKICKLQGEEPCLLDKSKFKSLPSNLLYTHQDDVVIFYDNIDMFEPTCNCDKCKTVN